MAHPRKLVRFLTVCCALASAAVSRGSDAGLTEVALREGPEPEVRFISGTTVYVEALLGGQWTGRSWNADGRINSPAWRRVEPAFRIEVQDKPDARNAVALATGPMRNDAGAPGARFCAPAGGGAGAVVTVAVNVD